MGSDIRKLCREWGSEQGEAKYSIRDASMSTSALWAAGPEHPPITTTRGEESGFFVCPFLFVIGQRLPLIALTAGMQPGLHLG